jgi:two-component system sensor histidine kinase YesM
VLAVFLVPLAADLFVKPVLELKRNLDKVFQGDYSVRMNVCPGRNELMKLGHSFNRMTEQLNHQLNTIADLRVQELQARLREKEAQIRALQDQINPHLLYNSLDVIKSIALLNDDRLVVGMAGNLADVYRYTAKMSDGEVTLKTELTALEKYLEITRIRFPKKFRSRITVHPRYYGCLLLKLTLQPIVENAVKYAVEPQGGNAAIIVNAYAHGNDLMIEIANNGEPFPEDKLKQLTERLNRITDSGSYREDGQSGSLGLVNVHARLVLKYGERYGVSITAIPQRGTVVSVRVPLRYGDERC